MRIRDMHYDVKSKLNKIDSQKYRDLLIPEIDWKLNEAQEIFIKAIAEPRYKSLIGFEINQRTIDDIKTLVVNQIFDQQQCIQLTPIDSTSYLAQLPTNYMFYVSGKVRANKGDCTNQSLRLIIRQHDDMFEESPFYNSSFEWRETNGTFYQNGIRIYTDGSFTPTHLCLNYIREPRYMHNAQDTQTGQYYMPNNVTLLQGFQDCELPEQVHREIVDLAVLIMTGDMQIPDYQVKQAKLRLSE